MAEPGPTLSSWKEIAVYLGRTVRTCQRLEAGMGLPVHRLDGSPKAHVFAYPHELDAWLARKAGEHEQARKRRRSLLLLLPATVVVAAAALFFANAFGVRRPERSIAIVLHPNLGQDRGWEHLPDGIAEDIRNALMQIRGFRVPGRISSMAVADGRLGNREMGRALNVEYVLGLGVQVAGEALRVTAELIDADDGFQRWAGKYDLRIGGSNVLVVEDQITRAVVDQLKVKLLAREEIALGKDPTANLEAYDLYMRGRALIRETREVAQSEALAWFMKALEKDPNFALAHVGIAWVHMNRIATLSEKPTEAGPQALAAVERALDLNPDLPEAHALNAWVKFLYNFDWEAAGSSFDKALELKPGDAMTRGMHAYYLLAQRRFGEARKEIRRAVNSDPLAPMLSAYYIWIHLFSGRYQEVLDELARIERSGRAYEFAYYGAGLVHLFQGRIGRSIELFEKAAALPHTIKRSEAGLAVAYVKLGDRARAEAIYKELRDERQSNLGVSATFLAWVAAELGDVEEALAWLDEAIKDHDHNLVSIQIQVEVFLPRLARDPRLIERLDKLGLPR